MIFGEGVISGEGAKMSLLMGVSGQEARFSKDEMDGVGVVEG